MCLKKVSKRKGIDMELKISEKIQAIAPSPTLEIDAKFKSMKAEGIDVVGFGAGEPDFDTPQFIKDAAIKAINDGFTKYTPASGTLDLKNAVCEKFKRDNNLEYKPENIVISNGAKHSLVNAFMAILNPGDEVLVSAPYWVSYPEMIKIADGKAVIIPTEEEKQFKFTVEDLKKYLTDKTKAIVLNSPCNPTGMLYSKAELEKIAEFAIENNLYVVSDEIYEHLMYNGEKPVSIASLSEEMKDRTIIINGVSKTYAMTGWRIGFTASNAKIAKAMSNLQSHATSNPNSIAQVAAAAALRGTGKEVEEMKVEFKKRRDYMVEAINKIDGVSCICPDGAFYIMMNIKKLLGKTYYGVQVDNVDVLCNEMLERAKVALVPGTGFAAPDFIRWSYATSLDNIKEGLRRFEAYVNGTL